MKCINYFLFILYITLCHFNGSMNAGADSEKFSANIENLEKRSGIAIEITTGLQQNSIELSRAFQYVLTTDLDQREVLSNKRRGNLIITDKFPSKKRSFEENMPGRKCVTFKQFIFDSVYQNKKIMDSPILLFSCVMNGLEENILEDLLHFSYHNKCNIAITFDYESWVNQNINEYEHLFSFFDSDCPQSDVTDYISKNPQTTMYFEPKLNKENEELMVKKNLTAIIIGYNLVTYIKNMVAQLESYTDDIIVVDNNSFYQPLKDYYKNEYTHTLLQEKENYGHRVFARKEVANLLGDLFILTDPDIYFPETMPSTLIEDMVKISKYYKSRKVGLALSIDRDDIRDDVFFQGNSIKEWESRFWDNRIKPQFEDYELYTAAVDTTFCLVNKKNNQNSIRIAGPYTSLHMPWIKNFQRFLMPGEYESYVGSISTSWFKK